jgi:hypothetical protein
MDLLIVEHKHCVLWMAPECCSYGRGLTFARPRFNGGQEGSCPEDREDTEKWEATGKAGKATRLPTFCRNLIPGAHCNAWSRSSSALAKHPFTRLAR